MATDGAATLANTAAPVFTSASYNFNGSDVGAWLYIALGGGWFVGRWYQIVITSGGGAATLNAAAGAGSTGTGLTTVDGIAAGASPTGATWAIDYSQQDTAQISYTDLQIDATTNTKVTSVLHPFTIAQVGNLIQVTSGSGFTTPQRVLILSVAAGVATCDKSLGTVASTGGVGKLGGACASIAGPLALAVASNTLHIQSGNYTHSVTLDIPSALSTLTWLGFHLIHGDRDTAHKPEIAMTANSTDLIATHSAALDGMQVFDNLSFSNSAGTPQNGIVQLSAHNTIGWWIFRDCDFDGFTTAINSDNVGAHFDTYNVAIVGSRFGASVIKNSTAIAVMANQGQLRIDGVYIHDSLGAWQVYSFNASVGINRSVIAFGAAGGVWLNVNQELVINASDIVLNIGTAIQSSGGHTPQPYLYLTDSIVDGLIVNGATPQADAMVSRNNAINGGNTNWPGSPGDVPCPSTPFVNPAAGDYSLSGFGQTLKGAGSGGADIGAIQSVAQGGGSWPFAG